jgi:cell division protein FtsI/penicillin-binding protein 2
MQHWRINLILAGIFLFGVVIIGRLFFIQILQDDFYKALSQGLAGLKEETEGARGEIFFRSGEPLAINKNFTFVFASPRKIQEKTETAKKLSEILNLDENLILEKLKKDNLYEVIKKRISEEEVKKIKELNLTGIYLEKEWGRYYPQETLASQLVGFLDAQKQGQYGLESYYDEILRGKRDVSGENLFLTIDYSIQFIAEKLLAEAQKNLDIEKGEIVVIDPQSGEILALANFPNFNPNQYSEITDFDIFQNSVTQKIFEPGSIFKPITMAAALNEEKITPQTTYQDPGEIKIGGYKIYNYEQRKYPGDITMTEVLEKSINTGAVFVEKKLSHNLFLKYIEKFGIFEPTGIDLQEIYSENKEFKKGYEINFATAAFGQGIEMTPIQLIRAYCAIANGGRLVKPHLLNSSSHPKNEEQIISQKTSSQLTAMLVSVVENGFAKAARIPGYYIAGKTGTAQISFAALGVAKSGYSDKTWQTFIGFAPAFNPQFLIMVKLYNPKTKTAEYSAVPIFHALSKYIINLWQIPPDYQE